jgi:DNA-binding NarL/FixJ family response regulator
MITVLIVDDNSFLRSALGEFFAREPDFEVCGMAENGREAIQEANRLHPDLIVLDLNMPVMNGLEAARVLKDIMPTVPLILYSALQDESSAKIAKSIGISASVSKGERVSVLIDKARGVIDDKAA